MVPAARPGAIPEVTASARAEHNIEDKPAIVPAAAAQPKINMTAADEPVAQASQPASLWAVSNDPLKNAAVKNEAKIAAASVSVQNPSHAFASAPGSAAAPAPAKEVTAPPAA